MLETKRLKLLPLTHEQLLLHKNDPVALAKNLGVNYLKRQNDPATANDLHEVIEFWLQNTLKHRDKFEWCTNWEIILKTERIAIGGIGFAGAPDSEGKAEIGYGLDVRYFNKGYASEAVQSLLGWRFSHQQLHKVIAHTPMGHPASQKVLIKNGFSEVGRNEGIINLGNLRPALNALHRMLGLIISNAPGRQ